MGARQPFKVPSLAAQNEEVQTEKDNTRTGLKRVGEVLRGRRVRHACISQFTCLACASQLQQNASNRLRDHHGNSRSPSEVAKYAVCR